MAELTQREADLKALRAVRKELQEIENIDKQLDRVKKDFNSVDARYKVDEVNAGNGGYTTAQECSQRYDYKKEHERQQKIKGNILATVFLVLALAVFAASCVYLISNFEKINVNDEPILRYWVVIVHFLVGLPVALIPAFFYKIKEV